MCYLWSSLTGVLTGIAVAGAMWGSLSGVFSIIVFGYLFGITVYLHHLELMRRQYWLLPPIIWACMWYAGASSMGNTGIVNLCPGVVCGFVVAWLPSKMRYALTMFVADFFASASLFAGTDFEWWSLASFPVAVLIGIKWGETIDNRCHKKLE